MQIINCVATANEIQFDFMLLNDGDQALKLNSASFRLTHNPAIIPAGTNNIELTYVGGSDFPAAFVSIPTTYNLAYNAATTLMNHTQSNGNYTSATGVTLPIGGPAMKVGRFSLKITNTNWVTGVSAGLAFYTSGNGAVVYIGGSTISSVMGSSTPSIFSTDTPCSLMIPVSCNIGSVINSTTPASCFNLADGTADITLSNAVPPVAWELNGNVIPGTGASNVITTIVSGNNTITVTDSTSCQHIINFSIGGPSAPLSMTACNHVDACTGGNGSVMAGIVSSAIGTPVYSWVDSLSTPVAASANASLPAGTYTLTVTDNCSSVTCSATIQETDTIMSDYSSDACDVYALPWGGSASASGTYSHTYTSSGGCDSVVTAHVTILPSTSSSFSDTAQLEYYLPWGDTVMATGSYDYTYTAANGCDSIVTANIVIDPTLGVEEAGVPASDLFGISGNRIVLKNERARAQLYTIDGRMVDMNDPSSGVYILSIYLDGRPYNYRIRLQ